MFVGNFSSIIVSMGGFRSGDCILGIFSWKIVFGGILSSGTVFGGLLSRGVVFEGSFCPRGLCLGDFVQGAFPISR